MRGKSNNRFKLTANEKGWILYDVGNSAFILMVSTILPIYFNYLAENAGISSVDYLAYWGYAASIVTLIVAVLGPVLGTLADTKGFKKPIFSGCVIAGCLACGNGHYRFVDIISCCIRNCEGMFFCKSCIL